MSIEAAIASLAKGAGWLPFILTAGQDTKLNTQRLLEAGVIGIVMAFIGFVAIVPRLEERIDRVLQGQLEAKAEMKVIHNRINVIEATRFTRQDGREIRERLRAVEKGTK